MSPLKKSSWRHFRRLGFGIWDLKRMAELEMLRGPREFCPPREGEHPPEIGIHLSISNAGFTWRSIEGAPADAMAQETGYSRAYSYTV